MTTSETIGPFEPDALGRKLNEAYSFDAFKENSENATGYAGWIAMRAGHLQRWVETNNAHGGCEAVILETIARMEGDLQNLRTLLKKGTPSIGEDVITGIVLSKLQRGPGEG